MTVNHWVAGSSPASGAKPYGVIMANAKQKKVVRKMLSQIEVMKKKATEKKESAEVIARKEQNMLNYYKDKFGKRFDEFADMVS
jgi:prophage DNA circulation protein